MMIGTVNQDYRVWYTLKLSTGAAALGVAAVDQTITIRNPQNTATMAAPTAVEFGNGLYYFDILASFSNTHGAGTYGGVIEVNSSSPVVVDTQSVSVDFMSANLGNGALYSLYNSPIGTAVWIDTFYGTSGTTVGVHGTAANPVGNEADAYTLAIALGIRNFYIRDGTVTLTSGTATAYFDWTFAGPGWSSKVDVNGKNVWGSAFHNITLVGTFDYVNNEGFDINVYNSFVGACTGITGQLNNCAIHSTLTLPTLNIPAVSSGGGLVLYDCYNWNGLIPARINFGGATEICDARFHGWHGHLLVQNMGNTNDRLEGEFQGARIELEDTCLTGTAILRQCFTLEDNTAGAVSIDTTGRIGEVNDIYLNASHGIGSWVDTGIGAGSIDGPSTVGIMANPGQTVTLAVQVTNSSGESIDGYTPTMNFIVDPSGSTFSGYPVAMTRVAVGLYKVAVTIPSGASAIGTYIASTSWTHPSNSTTQSQIFLINVYLPFGNSSVSPL